MVDDLVVVPTDEIQVDERLNYLERSVAILDRMMKTLRNKVVSLGKIQYQHQKGSEWMSEIEAERREHYLELCN